MIDGHQPPRVCSDNSVGGTQILSRQNQTHPRRRVYAAHAVAHFLGAQAGKPWPRIDRRIRCHQQYEGRYCLMPSQCDKLYHTLPARLTESDFAMPSCLVYHKKKGSTTTYHPRLQLDYYLGPCPRRRQILQGVSAEVSFRLPLW